MKMETFLVTNEEVQTVLENIVTNKLTRSNAVTWAKKRLEASQHNLLKVDDDCNYIKLLGVMACIAQFDEKITATEYLYHKDDLQTLLVDFFE